MTRNRAFLATTLVVPASLLVSPPTQAARQPRLGKVELARRIPLRSSSPPRRARRSSHPDVRDCSSPYWRRAWPSFSTRSRSERRLRAPRAPKTTSWGTRSRTRWCPVPSSASIPRSRARLRTARSVSTSGIPPTGVSRLAVRTSSTSRSSTPRWCRHSFVPSWELDSELARESAAIDPSGGAFPVIVFSHGGANDPIDYAHTLERIAVRGFIVAAPYHTNNTQDDVRRDFVNAQAPTTVFPCQDGRPTPCSRGGNVALSMADRVRDIDRVLDELPGWFGDRVDVGRAGVLGHSRGTVTALAAAGGTFPLTDPRVDSATCQNRLNPRFVSPDGVARCWPLAPGMEFGLGRTQEDQHTTESVGSRR